ncbi:MAG: DEAD/DEAH box helicase [Leptospirales bacterium]
MSSISKELQQIIDSVDATWQKQGKDLADQGKVDRIRNNENVITGVVHDKQNYRVSLNFNRQKYTCTCYETNTCYHICAVIFHMQDGEQKIQLEIPAIENKNLELELSDLAFQFNFKMKYVYLLMVGNQGFTYIKKDSDFPQIKEKYKSILSNFPAKKRKFDSSYDINVLLEIISEPEANLHLLKQIKYYLYDGRLVQFAGKIGANRTLQPGSRFTYNIALSVENPEKTGSDNITYIPEQEAPFFHTFDLKITQDMENVMQYLKTVHFSDDDTVINPAKYPTRDETLTKYYLVNIPPKPAALKKFVFDSLTHDFVTENKELLSENGIQNVELIPELWQTGPRLVLFISPQYAEVDLNEAPKAKQQKQESKPGSDQDTEPQLQLSACLNLVYAGNETEMQNFITDPKKYNEGDELEGDADTVAGSKENTEYDVEFYAEYTEMIDHIIENANAPDKQPDLVFFAPALKPGSGYHEILHNDKKVIVHRNSEKEKELLPFNFPLVYKKSTGKVRLSVKRLRSFTQEKLPELYKWNVTVRVHKDLSTLFNKTYRATLQIGSPSNIGWFEAKAKIDGISDKERVALIKAVKQKQELVQLDNGQWLNPEDIGLTKILKQIENLGLKMRQDGSVEGISTGNLYALNEELDFHTDKKSSEAIERIKKMTELPDVSYNKPGKNFNGKLRSYQKTGVAFFRKLFEYQIGGILADDMGLGKTMQTLAFLNQVFEDYPKLQPVLLVTPLSALSVWEDEVQKFFPKITMYRWHGADRDKKVALKKQILITTYATLNKDYKDFESDQFSMAILDEAQAIKNHTTLSSLAMRTINTTRIFCLTGTPLENRLADLWSLMDLCVPGLLGTRKSFVKTYDDESFTKEDSIRLKARMNPFLLRRHKEQVLKQLPPKIESDVPVLMTDRQKRVHEKVRLEAVEALANAGSKYIFLILPYLMRLRRISCHPDLGSGKKVEIGGSGKFQYLQTVIPELISSASGILIFSQFTDILKLAGELLKSMSVEYFYLDGSTLQKKRKQQVEDFQKGERQVFLISLKAGGNALTLHRADTVIHLDPWWNPQTENQATDRTHRIGQKRKVSVYRLYSKDSIEEKVLVLKRRKQALFNELFADGGFKNRASISKDEMMTLLSAEKI